MEALTICQPYAHLIAIGEKWVETRTWGTDYRGPLAIHAGKGRQYLEDGDDQAYPDMVFGAIVATAELNACVRLADLPGLARRFPGWLRILDHPHTKGPWCWVFRRVRRITPPITINGQRGLWLLPEEIADLIRSQVAEKGAR